MFVLASVMLALALALAGCAASGKAAADADVASSEFVRLEIAGMELKAVSAPGPTLPSGATASAMLFRRIEAGGVTMFIGLTEVSREQWRRLSGDDAAAWQDELAGIPVGMITAIAGPAKPMTGVTPAHVLDVLRDKRAGPFRLALPSSAAWQVACRAGVGSVARFSWGDSQAEIVASAWAVTENVNGGLPRDIASLAGNPWGIRDMHGNVWEMVGGLGAAGIELRGGASDQPVPQCQVENSALLPGDEAHPLVGFRLVLVR